MRLLGVVTAKNRAVLTAPPIPNGLATKPFFDDFPGTTVDPLKWTVYDRISDQGNNELNCCSPNNVVVSAGTLKITARHEDHVCSDTTTAAPNPRTMHYTSGHIATCTQPFLYGRIDVRAKIAGGTTGFWPCLWLLGYDIQAAQARSAMELGGWPGFYAEIDFAEFLAGARTQANCGIHWLPTTSTSPSQQVDITEFCNLGFDSRTQFAVYRCDWQAGSLIFSVDDETGTGFRPYKTITSAPGVFVPDIPMFVIINMAISGTSGPVIDADFPQTMEIDYVRIT